MNSNVNNILIIGLGMIGSSIALSSKAKGIKIYGFDQDKSIAEEAIKKCVIDEVVESFDEGDLNESFNEVDLIIIAVPP